MSQTKIQAADIVGWQAVLNVIRAKHGLGAATAVSPTTSIGSNHFYTQMRQMRNKIYETYNNEIHFRRILIDIPGTFDTTQKPDIDTKNAMDSTLNAMNEVCHDTPCVVNTNCPNTGGNVNATNSTYGTNGTDSGGYSTYSPTDMSGCGSDGGGYATYSTGSYSNYRYATYSTQANSTNANYGQFTTYAVNSVQKPIESIT